MDISGSGAPQNPAAPRKPVTVGDDPITLPPKRVPVTVGDNPITLPPTRKPVLGPDTFENSRAGEPPRPEPGLPKLPRLPD